MKRPLVFEPERYPRLLKRPQAKASVLEKARQDDPNRSWSHMARERLKQRINAMRAIKAVRQQMDARAWPDRQMTVRQADIACPVFPSLATGPARRRLKMSGR